MIDKIEKKVIKNFGQEWSNFDQSSSDNELKKVFNDYFKIFPLNKLNKTSIGIDIGCGSGRWAKYILPKVKYMYLIDPSKESIKVAKKNLQNFDNSKFMNIDVESLNLINEKFDFAYSLGVLHHIRDTQGALNICSSKLKKGAPFLLYLYYNFENRNLIFKSIWFISNFFRIIISVLPFKIKKIITNMIAFFIYLPLKFFYQILKFTSIQIKNLPLSYYHDKTFYMMKTDSLDRFGTLIEKRYSKKDIIKMLQNANFENITFSNDEPYWTVLSYKK